MDRRKTIAEHMVDILNENEEYSVDVGRYRLWIECLKRSNMCTKSGSVRLGSRVMDALEKSDKFEKGYIRYTRRVRVFVLKEEYRKGKGWRR